METTRHFVATVYVVNDGATVLHHHDKLDMWLPPGGHIDRDELPHEAARREVHEELGLDVDLIAPVGDLDSKTAQSLPRPQHFLLEDIDTVGDRVAHQHIDFIYYGRAETRAIDPGPGEAQAGAWQWFDRTALEEHADRFADDVHAAARRAIETVGNHHR